jgi:hypothetical protein
MSKVFGLVMGKSTAGKTTLCGTLPGKTLLLQCNLKESGSQSALAMSRRKKVGSVDVVMFDSVPELLSYSSNLLTDETYDNVYIDGGSAITFLIGQQPDIAPALKGKKGNTFGAYDDIKMTVVEVIEEFTMLTQPKHKRGVTKKPKHVFFTLTIDVKLEGGHAVDIMPVMLGKASWSEFVKISPTVVTLLNTPQEDGTLKRVMLTKEFPPFKGRVAGILDEDNPGVMTPDLGELIALAGY